MIKSSEKHTVYVVGYQPVEIVNRNYYLVDLLHTILEKNPVSAKTALIEYAKTFTLLPGDFLLLNTIRNKDLIPYFQAQSPLIYDPPYVASERDIYKVLQNLNSIVGSKDSGTLYATTLNSVRATLNLTKENLTQEEYYNSLLLLSDVNQSNSATLEQFLLSKRTPYVIEVRKKIIFVGDPVDPKYFAQLNAQGIYVVAFAPYEFFTLPCDKIDNYYFDNPMFQPSLYTLVELRRLINRLTPDAIVFNPGGLYLTQEEADYFVYSLQQDLPAYKLPGTYNAPPIQI
jgi:hypothetical protein